MCVCVCVCVHTWWNYHLEVVVSNASVIFFEFLRLIDFGRPYLNIDE